MKLASLLIAALWSGAALAGTVSPTSFEPSVVPEVIVANGVKATSSSGFVLYQHGSWDAAASPRPIESNVAQVAAAPVGDPTPIACGREPPLLVRGLSPRTAAYRSAYLPLIRDAECRHSLPTGLLDALVLQESHYVPFAVSPVGAGGLTQLMPKTAAGLGVANRFDPIANVEGGARYLRSMIDHYASVPLALAAYNAGRRSVDRSGGIPMNRETPGYVRKVLGFFNQRDEGATANAPLISRIRSYSFLAEESE